MVSGYVVELVCSKQPEGSRMRRASASVMLASGVGYTAALVSRLPATTFAGMATACDTEPFVTVVPANDSWMGKPFGFTASRRVTLSVNGPAEAAMTISAGAA